MLRWRPEGDPVKREEGGEKSEERRERREVERVTWQGSMAKKKVGP